MIAPEIERLRSIKDFPTLIKYLRDELDWPIDESMTQEDMVFEYAPEEVGLDQASAVKIDKIVRLRPLASGQPWGIFYIEFKPGKLPITVLRRILRALVIKKRESARDRQAWQLGDLLFLSTLGESESRHINLAHFSEDGDGSGRAVLRVVDWDEQDTHFHILRNVDELRRLRWPADTTDVENWRNTWGSAFALKPGEVITTSKQLAVEMARLACVIRGRVNAAMAIESPKGPLRRMYKAFQEVLLHDLKEDDFADMYAQTLTYGLFAARRSRPLGITVENARDMVPNTNPFLRDLLADFAEVGGITKTLDFDELGIDALVEMLNRANMDAIVADFGDKTRREDPVIYFYERFLTEYDAKKKVKRGIFFTPRPVVSFIVRSVDELLRSEFGLKDGLADTTTWGEMRERHPDLKLPPGAIPNTPFVQILDPAVGTGTFLVEVIDLVFRTMRDKWQKAGHMLLELPQLWNEYVPNHLLPRLYGFELMMAPYAIAHMKIGLKLEETGYRTAKGERLRVYLTNSLEPPQETPGQFEEMAPALAHEAQAVNEVKRSSVFTVVVGNPPYSDASQNLGPQFEILIEGFRFYQGERIRDRGAIRFEHVINNDYVKFWGLALRLLTAVPMGIVCLITSNSYLGGKSFRGVRDSMLASSAHARVTDLHGEGWSGRLAHIGVEDENVFEIQTGVAIARLSKSLRSHGPAVEYGELIGNYAFKATELLNDKNELNYVPVPLDPRSYCSFLPSRGEGHVEYWDYPQVDSLFYQSVDGIKTSRDGLVIANTYRDCMEKIKAFSSSDESDSEIEARFSFQSNRLNLAQARRHVAATFDTSKIHPIFYRPFDIRFIYYDGELILSHRMNTMPRVLGEGADAIVCASSLSAKGFDHALAARSLCSNKYSSHDINSRMFLVTYFESNLSETSLQSGVKPEYLDAARVPSDLPEVARAKMFGPYVLAILNAPGYRDRFVEEIQQDFPRVPLPATDALLTDLAAVGDALGDAHCLTLQVPDDRFVFHGDVGGRCTAPRLIGNKVWIGTTSYVEGVSPELWELRLAGYQVCRSWFTAGGRSGLARQSGRLTEELVDAFRLVLFCASEAMRLRSSADATIDRHGGWSRAFQPAHGSD
jgi:hypothetical protein